MWLLKLHFSISILCLLTFIGFRKVFKEQITNNGFTSTDKKKSITGYFLFFTPILNIAGVLFLFVMIAMTKKDLDRWVEEHKKKEESAKSNGE